ncbi:MAG: tRNA (adenosine(37)-N6)-threonylcarbamoyltransferase complex ATPase subunit type 1 TsaE [Actinomycetota bacterium]|nr:tRNA (adenosine(37)-N6)-threonylcarbamoyltransferase complex ATPase subunit type 1 TsaE [Actinomycetota bacterium]
MTRQLGLISRGPDDTKRLAATVGEALRAGDVVALTGELGAGKTCFVQGAARALGVTERVTSPSFVLRRQYEGRFPILHLDVYRLETLQDVVELGYEDALDRAHITFIEWGDAMSPLLPPEHLEVEFRLPRPPDPAQPDHDTDERLVRVRARGDDWLRRMAGLAVDLQPWRAEGSGQTPTGSDALRAEEG